MPSHPQTSAFAPIPEILDDLRQGKMVILTDDEDRENEGDLIIPAQHITPQAVTFMLSVARGYLCLSLTEADCDRLELHPQSSINNTVRGTAFTVSIDLHPKHGGTTGVSAKERAKAINMAIDHNFGPADFVRPGHINPLRARDGGTLVRTGQTEGSIDLCKLAGLYPAAAIIEIMRDDGEMARLPDLISIAKQHNLKICSVAQIIQHRLARESLVKRLEPLAGTPVNTKWGTFNLIAFSSAVDPLPHIALTLGNIGALDHTNRPIEHTTPALVRMHRRSLLGDVFGISPQSTQFPSGHPLSGDEQLNRAMSAIKTAGQGALVYLRPEGSTDTASADSPIEQLLQTIRRNSFDKGADTPDLAHPLGHAQTLPTAMRQFGIGGQILRQLGLSKLKLLTNSSAALPGLEAFGLEIVARQPL